MNLFVALDVESKEEAFRLAEELSGQVYGFKVGPKLGFTLDLMDWSRLARLGHVFIDYKFFDIPSVVKAGVKQAFDLGASYCTVHLLNGETCLRQLAELETELQQKRDFRILGVSLLTSFDQETNKLPLIEKTGETVVSQLCDVGASSGISGFVCSPHEVLQLKATYGSRKVFVTPGVRLESDPRGDQKRVATPYEAWNSGSDFLVMGRSITSSEKISETIQQIREQWIKSQG